jgi:hypothetical protein
VSQWTWAERKSVRETEGVPAWVPLGDDDPDFKRIWVEDDARPPDGESGEQAWKRIYGERYDRNNALAEHDATDEVVRLHTFNRVYSYAYDGATIWQYMPERKFD